MNNFYDPPQGKQATKSKSVRYFGMTRSQIGILAGVAALALLIVCSLSWFILLPPPSAPVSAPTATQLPPTPPSVEAVPLTVTPSPTPPPVIATNMPPVGWAEFQTQGATLWLPNNFVGGDILHQEGETIQKINRLGIPFRNVIVQIKNAQPTVQLWMIDKIVNTSLTIMTVKVHHYVETTDKTIDQFVTDDLNGNFNGTPVAMIITVNETKKMTILGRETRRQTYQQNEGGKDATGIAYYIKDGADFWIVDYLMEPNDYIDMLPIVEQSIGTFYLVQ